MGKQTSASRAASKCFCSGLYVKIDYFLEVFAKNILNFVFHIQAGLNTSRSQIYRILKNNYSFVCRSKALQVHLHNETAFYLNFGCCLNEKCGFFWVLATAEGSNILFLSLFFFVELLKHSTCVDCKGSAR